MVSYNTGGAPLNSPAFTGVPTAPTAAPLDNSTEIATDAYCDAAVAVETTARTTAVALKANIASPALTGIPTVPTATALTNNTQAASTAYTDAAVAVETAARVGYGFQAGEALTSGESIIARHTVSGGQSLTLSRVQFTYFTALKTESCSHVDTTTQGTAAGVMTYAGIGIYSVDGATGNLTLLNSTADLHATLWAATFTGYSAALSSSFSKVAGTRYAVAFLAVGGATPPALSGHNTTVYGFTYKPRLAAYVSGTTLPSTVTDASLTEDNNVIINAVIKP